MIAPEDEYFKTDEIIGTDAIIDENLDSTSSDTEDALEWIDPDDVEWDFIEQIEDDHLD